ncbi:MAG TPA: PilZ domain-containing protein [Rhizomicrobium sp.]|jgi:hypothetical protein|nr:PilZ domain-containing protein [Rhizomicrobium sp.]
MSPNLPALHVERRPERRRRTLLGGCVAFDDGKQAVDCTIRNLSTGGARITLPPGREIPGHVFLIHMRDRLVYDAVIVWKKGSEAGLCFSKVLQLGEFSDPRLAYLQELWLERAARR